MEPLATKPASLIAVVDDEEAVCRALERLLRSVGFEVETYPSGAAAYLRKPVDDQTLLSTLATAMGRPRTKRAPG